MEKLVYLFYKSDPQPAAPAFTRRVLDGLIPALKLAGGWGFVFNVADLNDAVREVSPSRLAGEWEHIAGALHFWVDSVDQRFELDPIIARVVARSSAYLVTESVPQKTPRTWADGERRPGVTQLSIICRAQGVSEEEFYHNWQQVHSTQSFALHPSRTSYVRNDVSRVLTAGAVPYRMIVLEHWAELGDFTHDERYFGGPEVVREMYRDLPGFADSSTITTGPASEYAVD